MAMYTVDSSQVTDGVDKRMTQNPTVINIKIICAINITSDRGILLPQGEAQGERSSLLVSNTRLPTVTGCEDGCACCEQQSASSADILT